MLAIRIHWMAGFMSYALCALSAWGDIRENRPPNIIVMLADDLGYGELGCQGNPEIPTPHIDSIASSGVRFTSGYVTAPNCSPSRAGLLTGKFPTRFGYEFNPIGARNEDPGTGLPASEKTLAEVLHDRGYATGLIGKWHLGGSADFHPHRHGFDTFFGFMHEGHYFLPAPWTGAKTLLRRRTLPGGGQGRWGGGDLLYSTHMGHDEPAYDANNPIIRDGQPVVERDYLTDAFTREALAFMDLHKDKPYFLQLSYNAVHSPLQARKEDLRRLSGVKDMHRRIFAGMLIRLDESVGRILNQLRKDGLEDNTLVFFLSDNGGPTRELTSSNLPLRGEKGQMFEGGLRVPFLVSWKGRIPSGMVYHKPVSSTDIFTTASVVSGAEYQGRVDGVDLIPFITGDQSGSPHDWLYWRQGSKAALRKGDWKLVNNSRSPAEPRWELYDLSTDLSERVDLSAQEPLRVREMVQFWSQMNNEMSPPLFR